MAAADGFLREHCQRLRSAVGALLAGVKLARRQPTPLVPDFAIARIQVFRHESRVHVMKCDASRLKSLRLD